MKVSELTRGGPPEAPLGDGPSQPRDQFLGWRIAKQPEEGPSTKSFRLMRFDDLSPSILQAFLVVAVRRLEAMKPTAAWQFVQNVMQFRLAYGDVRFIEGQIEGSAAIEAWVTRFFSELQDEPIYRDKRRRPAVSDSFAALIVKQYDRTLAAVRFAQAEVSGLSSTKEQTEAMAAGLRLMLCDLGPAGEGLPFTKAMVAAALTQTPHVVAKDLCTRAFKVPVGSILKRRHALRTAARVRWVDQEVVPAPTR